MTTLRFHSAAPCWGEGPINRATALRAFGCALALATIPLRRIRAWHAARRTRTALMRLDDRTLRDIGLHRSEIASVAATGSLDRRVRANELDAGPLWRTRLPAGWDGDAQRFIDHGRTLRAMAVGGMIERGAAALWRGARRLRSGRP